ncbi:MAG: long-chain fatty aldehyde decarbonylase [Cyanobium sp.]
MSTPSFAPDFDSAAYRDAHSRINAVVVVGEGLADRQFRLLARSIPEDRDVLLHLAAMEARHARDFVGCGRHLAIRPDLPRARRLFAPLADLFRACDRAGDLPACLVIQGLVVECFAVAAYDAYLPVADAYARSITAAVLADEAEHLAYAERWLGTRFAVVQDAVQEACRRALPITLAMLRSLTEDLRSIGMDPEALLAGFALRFQRALEAIGFDPPVARRLIVAAALASVPG